MSNALKTGYLAVVLAALCSAPLSAQLTIPQALTRAGESLWAGPSEPDGPPPSVEEIAARADLVVRGTLGQPRSYLSPDEMDVYTDYPIEHAVFLYNSPALSTARPGVVPTIAVTLLGGTVTISGLNFVSTHGSLPSLTPGSEYLLLLHQQDGKYFLAGKYYGAFAVSGGRLTALVRHRGFGEELTAQPLEEASEHLVSLVRAARGSVK